MFLEFNKIFNSHFNNLFKFVEIPHYKKALKISLRDFCEMDEKKKSEAIERFNLQKAIDAAGGISRFKHLSASPLRALESVSLVDLILGNGKVKWALMPHSEFFKLTLNDVKNATPSEMKIIARRLESMRVTKYHQTENMGDMPLVHLWAKTGKEISQHAAEIPSAVLQLLTASQIQGLDMSVWSNAQLRALLGKDAKQRFALFTPTQVQALLPKRTFNHLISDEQLQKLDLSKESLRSIFYGKDTSRRFALLSSDQVQSILPKLDRYFLNLITEEQFKKLDLSALSKEQVAIIFPPFDKATLKKEYDQKCYACVKTCINGEWTVKETRGISDEELEKISTKTKETNAKKFKTLSSVHFLQIKHKLSLDNRDLGTTIVN